MTHNTVETLSRGHRSQPTPLLVFVNVAHQTIMRREYICEVRTLFANDLPIDKQSLLCQIMRNNLTICSHNIPVSSSYFYTTLEVQNSAAGKNFLHQ